MKTDEDIKSRMQEILASVAEDCPFFDYRDGHLEIDITHPGIVYNGKIILESLDLSTDGLCERNDLDPFQYLDPSLHYDSDEDYLEWFGKYGEAFSSKEVCLFLNHHAAKVVIDVPSDSEYRQEVDFCNFVLSHFGEYVEFVHKNRPGDLLINYTNKTMITGKPLSPDDLKEFDFSPELS